MHLIQSTYEVCLVSKTGHFSLHFGTKRMTRRTHTLLSDHTKLYLSAYKYFFFSGCATQRGLWPSRSRGFVITHDDAPQSVGLLWTSDQLVAEISTRQHTTHATDKHPCPR
jgi:hypothetical protein